MKTDKQVTVLILTYNQLAFTVECISSLLKSDYQNIRILVVDNGSSDGTVDTLTKKFPDITILRNEKNLGCAGGRNTGIKYYLDNLDSDYLFFLDNDIIIEKSAIGELVSLMDSSPQNGIVAPFWYFYNQPDTIFFAGGAHISWKKGVFYGEMRGEKRPLNDLIRTVEFVPGGIIFAKREAVQIAGLFDERYFIYFEDPDWVVRVTQAGATIMATSRASVLHKVSQSVGMETPLFYYYRTRNRLLFMKKNARKTDRFFFFFYFIFELIVMTAPTLLLNKMYKQLKGVFVGIMDHFKGIYGQKLKI
ncbi:MAG: glycosyltransferase family 2 protein [Candidatus Ancaeobacter aquaticus]|nr:glycosyltransferase family 2 protein [Candidatus Ancaeobacter aquaticus]